MDTLTQQGLSLEDRLISSYPIAISTSLALETLLPARLPVYDTSRIPPPPVALTDYSHIYINIFTIYRNISSSVKREVFYKSTAEAIVNVMLSEIETIFSLFSVEGKNLISPVFYSMSYKQFFKHATKNSLKIRGDKTEYQLEYSSKYQQVLKLLKKHDFIEHYDSVVKSKNSTSSLILTHIPYDLLSYKEHRKLDLLESNTGKLKTRNSWNSKYMKLPGKDMSHLPYLDKLLLILGDKIMITPAPIQLRRQIYDTSINRNWTSATTISKVLLDLSIDITDPFAKQWINNL